MKDVYLWLLLLFHIYQYASAEQYYKPGPPVIEATPSNGALGLLEGETGSLWCRVMANGPATVTWTKGTDPTFTHEGEELRFAPAKKEDNDEYTCTATNDAGSSSKRFIVGVHEVKSLTSVLSDEVRVNNAHGSTGQKLTWYNTRYMSGDSTPDPGHIVAEWNLLTGGSANIAPGYGLNTTTGDLLIPSVTLQQEGLYTAHMKDMMSGDKYGYTRLTVNAKYVTEVEPEFKDKSPVEGEIYRLLCRTTESGKPTSTAYCWYKNGNYSEPLTDGGRISGTKTDVLEITALEEGDDGEYECSRPNEAGRSITTGYMMEVLYGPKGRPTVHVDNEAVAVETTACFTCDASTAETGRPDKYKYIWQKDGMDTSTTESSTYCHYIHNISDDGDFTCGLDNGIGTSHTSLAVYISVEAPVLLEIASDELLKPVYNDTTFTVGFTVSGTSQKQFLLRNSSGHAVDEYFIMDVTNVTGQFSYGQTQADRVTWRWRLDDDEPQTCDNVTFFNDNYTFIAEGEILGKTSMDRSFFRISVQYPSIWNNTSHLRESSTQGVPKVLVCDVCAEPAPILYSWMFMGNHTVNGTGRELDLGYVTSEDFGWYTCTVTNVINGAQHENTFNITLEEKGSPHVPVGLAISSKTARTFLVQWKIAFDGGYDIELYELTVCKCNDTCDEAEEQVKHVTDCTGNVGDVCQHRIKQLLPHTRYGLKLRAKNMRPDGDSFSGYIPAMDQTKALPDVKGFQPDITPAGIIVTWLYGNTYSTHDTEVGVVIMYKVSPDVNYTRHPVDVHQKVPAAAQATTIYGTFTTSDTYSFQYLVYEGDQISTEHAREIEAVTTNGTDVGVIIGIVIGCLVLIGLVAIIAVLGYRRRQGLLRSTQGQRAVPPSVEDLAKAKHFSLVEEEADYAEVGELGPGRSNLSLAGGKQAQLNPTRTTYQQQHAAIRTGGNLGQAEPAYLEMTGLTHGSMNHPDTAPAVVSQEPTNRLHNNVPAVSLYQNLALHTSSNDYESLQKPPNGHSVHDQMYSALQKGHTS